MDTECVCITALTQQYRVTMRVGVGDGGWGVGDGGWGVGVHNRGLSGVRSVNLEHSPRPLPQHLKSEYEKFTKED